MKKILLALSALLPSLAMAGEHGYTWLGALKNATGISIPEHVLMFAGVCFIVIVCGLIYRMKVAKAENPIIPDRGFTYRNIVEAYGNFIYSQCEATLGPEVTPRYYPFIATLFLVILLTNIMGLIPGIAPATQVFSTTFAIGIFAFIFYNAVGIKYNGLGGYLKELCGPFWAMAILFFPIEIISHCIRPLSLGLRLFGNMTGDHLVLQTFTEKLFAWVVPTPFYLLGLLVCCIQAYVFTMLTMVYISLALPHHDHGEEKADA